MGRRLFLVLALLSIVCVFTGEGLLELIMPMAPWAGASHLCMCA